MNDISLFRIAHEHIGSLPDDLVTEVLRSKNRIQNCIAWSDSGNRRRITMEIDASCWFEDSMQFNESRCHRITNLGHHLIGSDEGPEAQSIMTVDITWTMIEFTIDDKSVRWWWSSAMCHSKATYSVPRCLPRARL